MHVKESTLILKRFFDICMSIFGLIILSPIFLIIAVLIKINSKGAVFFRQTRVGLNGKEFKIYKFRTMVTDAEKKGMQITVGNDSRVTSIGKIIRKCKMDEIPQLINVLIGDMSFVGPRPEVPKYVEMYNEADKEILMIRPGITDIASIEYRNENEILGKSENPEKTYIEEVMPAKIKFNKEYLSNISIKYDIYLIIKTVVAILK